MLKATTWNCQTVNCIYTVLLVKHSVEKKTYSDIFEVWKKKIISLPTYSLPKWWVALPQIYIFLRMALKSCFLLSFVELHSAVSEEKSKMSQPIRGQGGHLVFPIGPKNTNLVEDVEILLPVKFRWIPFSGFRGEVENVSANQRPRRPSCFSDRPEKHKPGRGRWDLVSCQVSLNSVWQFQRRSRKCEKLTTTDRRRTTYDHNSALEPSAQVH